MNNFLSYKGYHAKVNYSYKDQLLYGKIEGINDLVTFESDDLKNVELEFQRAVEDYLQFCKENGKTPEKEYKGTFNVRIKPELHKQLAYISMLNDESLNKTVEKALQYYVDMKNRNQGE